MVSSLQTGGWPAVDKAFARPPATTEQVMHYDKYVANEAPVALTVPDGLADRMGTGWSVGSLYEYEVRNETIAPYRRNSVEAYLQTDEADPDFGSLRLGTRRLRIDYGNPLLNVDDVLAASFTPDDGHCTPESVVMGYASGARRHGATVLTNVEATAIDARSSRSVMTWNSSSAPRGSRWT